MGDQQERDLARGLRDGKADAWRALYDAYAVPVWRAVARLLGPDAADVADVVQETFLAAARSARSYDPERGSLWVWLTGIARRHVALHYRKKGQRDRLQLAAGNGQVPRPPESAPDQLAAAELATLVRATLAELPDDYETLLTAKYLDDVSVDDLAGRTRSTATAVRSKLARARQAFRELFEKHAVSPP